MGPSEPIFSQSKKNLLSYFARSTGLNIVYPVAMEPVAIDPSEDGHRQMPRVPMSLIRQHQPKVIKLDREFVPPGFAAIVFGASEAEGLGCDDRDRGYDSVTVSRPDVKSNSVTSFFRMEDAAPVGRSVFLIALPDGLEPGDVVRLKVKCLLGGEYEFECAI